MRRGSSGKPIRRRTEPAGEKTDSNDTVDLEPIEGWSDVIQYLDDDQLMPLAKLVLKILALSEKFSQSMTCQASIQDLYRHCACTLTICSKAKNKNAAITETPAYNNFIEESIGLLERVQEQLKQWAIIDSNSLIFMHNSIVDEINNFHRQLGDKVHKIGFEPSIGRNLWDLAVSMHPEDLKRITRTLIGRAPEIDGSHDKFENFDFSALKAELTGSSGSNSSAGASRAVRDWSPYITKASEQVVGEGYFGQVYKAKFVNLPKTYSDAPTLAVKVLFGYRIDPSLAFRDIAREAAVWQALQHPNIVPFIGVCYNWGKLPSLISAWMPNGTLAEYAKQVDLQERMSLMISCAEGLHYLHNHEEQIVHGDFKGINILIDGNKNPRICDFGLSKMARRELLWKSNPTSARGTLRWMAPELLREIQTWVNYETDVYAFAMTYLEIITGSVPFPKLTPAQVLLAVGIEHQKPERPTRVDLPDGIWNMLMRCWCEIASKRPTMTELTLSLHTQLRAIQEHEIEIIGGQPIATTEDFDIWEGLYLNKYKVDLKIMRYPPSSRGKIRFDREMSIWKSVCDQDAGRHIVHLYGIITNEGDCPVLINPSLHDRQTALNYCISAGAIDLLPIIRGIAEGVSILHSRSIVHGDLRGINILIGDQNRPLISDFTKSKMLEDSESVVYTNSKGTISSDLRWLAPEVLVGEGRLSMKSDIYSLGMTTLELLTGARPFDEIRREIEVTFMIVKGERPRRPEATEYLLKRGLTDFMWELLQSCWHQKLEERIDIQAFLDSLESIVGLSEYHLDLIDRDTTPRYQGVGL